MNIFKILSNGDGSVQEPNVSAYLGYLLDPNQEHGLQDNFLKIFLEPIIEDSNIMNNIKNSENSVIDLSRNSEYSVEIVLEKKVKTKNNKDRDIDIVIYIYNKRNEILSIICVENKIRNSSAKKGQLDEELEGIKNEIKAENKEVSLAFIFLTPDKSTNVVKEFLEFKSKYSDIVSKHYSWQEGDGDNSESIIKMLTRILEVETIGLIEPINEYSKYTMKAFLNFIRSDFSSYKKEKEYKRTKFKKAFREYIRDVYNELEFDKNINVSDLKDRVSRKVLKDNLGIEINQGTLNAQIYCAIVNAKVRKHYNIKYSNKDKFDMFYYTNESDTSFVKKIDINNPPNNINYFYTDK